MNLSQIRQALGEQSGQYGFFTDAQNGDWSDKAGLMTNATYYINAGIRYLDRRWSMSGTARRRAYSVVADQWNFEIVNADFIRRIDLTTSAGVVSRLENKTYQQLRDHYAKEWASVTAGKPLYWAIVPESENIGELIDPNFLTEPIIMDDTDQTAPDWKSALISNPNKWVCMQSSQWSWASGVLSWDKAADESDPFSAGIYLGRYADASVVVDLSVSVNSGVISFGLFDYDGTTFNLVASQQGVSSSSDFELEASAPWNVIGIGVESDQAGEGSVSRVSIAEKRPYNIVTMPPSDAVYTLNVFGDFTNNALEGDLDTNYWTETHPELVVRAARVQMEMDQHRNVSGATAFQTQLEGELDRIFANDQFAFVSGYTWQEACRRG